jgi:hypothetical protein
VIVVGDATTFGVPVISEPFVVFREAFVRGKFVHSTASFLATAPLRQVAGRT